MNQRINEEKTIINNLSISLLLCSDWSIKKDKDARKNVSERK